MTYVGKYNDINLMHTWIVAKCIECINLLAYNTTIIIVHTPQCICMTTRYFTITMEEQSIVTDHDSVSYACS